MALSPSVRGVRRPRVLDDVLRSRWRVAGVVAALALIVGGIVVFTRSDSSTNTGVGLVSVQMVSPTTAFAAGEGRILRSDDGGKSWKPQPLVCTTSCPGALRVYDLEMLGETDGWAATSLGVFKTADGVRWTEQATGQPHTPALVEFVSREQGWLVTGTVAGGDVAELSDTVVAKTTDSGATWTPLTAAPADVQDLCFSTPDDGWLATKTGAFHTTDGGATWALALQGAAAQRQEGSTALQCIVPGEVWAEFATGSANSTARALALGIIADGGQRYAPVAAPGAPAGSTHPPPFAVIDGTTAFLIDYAPNDQSIGGSVVSTSGQRNAVTSLGVKGSSYTPKALSFVDKDHGVLVGAATSRPSTYATTDGGQTWTSAKLPAESPITRPGGASTGS
jgi:photosystem II stability/assembly factor-like uncharacterized protein